MPERISKSPTAVRASQREWWVIGKIRVLNNAMLLVPMVDKGSFSDA